MKQTMKLNKSMTLHKTVKIIGGVLIVAMTAVAIHHVPSFETLIRKIHGG